MEKTGAVHEGLGDPLPPDCHVLEIHLGELEQLFNAIDPAPFRERDLDPKAEEFIVGWARELRSEGPMALVVSMDRHTGTPEDAAMLKDAIREFFKERATVTRRRLRQLFRLGRTSLMIGLVFLAASIFVGDVLASALRDTRFGGMARESLLIGGWVAMWRPLEIFLYDWWPIGAEARLFDRLSAMAVRIVPAGVNRPTAGTP